MTVDERLSIIHADKISEQCSSSVTYMRAEWASARRQLSSELLSSAAAAGHRPLSLCVTSRVASTSAAANLDDHNDDE